MDNVRPRDITYFQRKGLTWVAANTGGISTFASRGGVSGRIWTLDAGYDYGALIIVWNDHGQHWSWEPANDMILTDYRAELSRANLHFY
jgi:hypothetical protein